MLNYLWSAEQLNAVDGLMRNGWANSSLLIAMGRWLMQEVVRFLPSLHDHSSLHTF